MSVDHVPLIMILKPHLESDGTHRERFEACLSDELICISRQPLSDGARALITRGHGPVKLLTIRHHDRVHASFRPAPIGELAKWTYSEADRGRIRRVRWVPFEMAPRSCRVEAPAADDGLAGVSSCLKCRARVLTPDIGRSRAAHGRADYLIIGSRQIDHRALAPMRSSSSVRSTTGPRTPPDDARERRHLLR